MEAATPLRHPRVHVLANGVVVDGLMVDDSCVVELVRSRAEAGEDPVRVVRDALGIGARVLDREHAGATVELFRADLEKSTREADAALAKRAEELAQGVARKVDELFGPDSGHVTKVIRRHFSDESSTAVQHQIRRAVEDVLADSREKLLKQFSSADGSNPLADFKMAQVRQLRALSDQQDAHLRSVSEQMAGLRVELQKLQDEKAKNTEVAAELERSTAKGRPYEEAVFEAVDAIARGQGDDCEAVGDERGAGGRKGDVLVGIDGCGGRPRGHIVFEAKNSAAKSRKAACEELEAAMAQRDADYGVWVVPSEDKLPSRHHQLREVAGDKLFVIYDPEEGGRLALEVAYSLARARVLMGSSGAEGLDPAALQAEAERALGAMEDVRRIKSQLTAATTGIDTARTLLDGMADTVRAHLRQIDALVGAGSA